MNTLLKLLWNICAILVMLLLGVMLAKIEQGDSVSSLILKGFEKLYHNLKIYDIIP